MRAMKNSGIEWIGEIPLGWEIRRIKSIGTYRNGLTYSPNDLVGEGEGTLVFRSSNIQNGALSLSDNVYVSCKIPEFLKVKQGDILICSRNGSKELIGKNAIIDIDGDYSFGAFMMIFRCANPRYIYYILNSSLFTYYLNSFLTSTVNQLTAENFGNMKFAYCPDIDGQNRIVSFLDAKCAEIDALIAAKEKTNTLLKERRQSIIYEAVTKGLDPTVPMKNSGIEWIGEIPEGWSVCRIKHLIDKSHPYPVGDGDHGMIKADDYQDEGIPYIRVLNLTWGAGLNLDNLVFISEEMNDRIKNSELRPGDILIAKTGATIGKTAIVPASLPLSNTTSHVGKITISQVYDTKYFFYVMTSFVVQKQIIDSSSMQSTRPELGIDGLKNLIVTFPPLETQKGISQYLDCRCAEIDSMICSTEDIIKALREYRQSLIYEAVTGKIEV